MANKRNGLNAVPPGAAPPLPAMGIYSYHNDSPPFAAASTSAEPEQLSLDSTLPSSRSSESSGQPNLSGSSAMPIPQRGFTPSLPSVASSSIVDAHADGGHERAPTNGYDEELSSSRSRRLVSGYIFGNPHSPIPGSSESGNNGPEDGRQPTPPIHDQFQGRDSPPLTEITSPSSPVSSGTGQQALQSGQPGPGKGVQNDKAGNYGVGSRSLHTMANLSIDDNPIAEGSEGEGRIGSAKTSRSDSGYDALLGLNDGEADLDEKAIQPTFTTTEYLQGMDGEQGEYRFPKHRLRKTMKDESKVPLVIVACGSFSPPTYLHLRMFEMAKDEIVESQTFEIMGGYYSPVSSKYKKAGLAPALDRVRMCELAVEHTSTWLMVDPWEAGQPEYQRTAVVLEHFDEMLNIKGGGVTMSDGKKRRYKIMLLAGGDLIESFGEPGVWSEPDLHIILGRFGCLIVERAGSDVWAFLLSHDILYHHRRNVIVIKQLIYNDISSTKVRLFVRRGMSIKYLLPNSVIQYIYDQKLYR